MMSYKLRCSSDHVFEGWFRSMADYDAQSSRGLLTCPVCGDDGIEKAIMAPAISRARQNRPLVAPATEAKPAGNDAAPSGVPAKPAPPKQEILPAVSASEERTAKLLHMMRHIQNHVETNFENVGKQFPEVVRKMHHGEAEHRDVFGEATVEDAKDLIEEGIPVMPLPKLPKLDG